MSQIYVYLKSRYLVYNPVTRAKSQKNILFPRDDNDGGDSAHVCGVVAEVIGEVSNTPINAMSTLWWS